MRIILVHIIILGVILNCCAQEHQNIFLTKYTQNEGLSSFNIKKIWKDKFGFFWIATQDGLNYFNGRSFEVFDINNKFQRLLGVDIRDIFEDSIANEIWVLAATGGISIFDTRTKLVKRTIAIPSTDNNQWSNGFIRIGDLLWIYTSDGLKIYEIAKCKWKSETEFFSNKNAPNNINYINKILKDCYGNIWCFIDNYGIVLFNSKTHQRIKMSGYSNSFKDISFNDAVFIESNRLLICTDKGFKIVNFDSAYSIKTNDNKYLHFSFSDQVYSVAKSKNYIFLSTNEGLFRLNYELSMFTKFIEPEFENTELWCNSVRTIYAEDENNLWLGCKNGFAKANTSSHAFRSFFSEKSDKRKLNNVFSLNVINKSELYIGLEHGLQKVNIDNGTFVNIDDRNSYFGILNGPGTEYLASNQKGTFLLRGNKEIKISSVYKEFKGFEYIQYNSVVNYGDSVLVLGTESLKGIIIWNYIKHNIQFVNTKSGSTNKILSSDIVNKVFKNNSGQLLVLSDNIISLLDIKKNLLKEIKLQSPVNKSNILYYFDICEIGNEYWIAAYGTGIINVDHDFNIKAIYSERNGLSNKGVNKLFNYHDSIIVITTNYGLSVFDLLAKKFKNYYARDGLHNNAFEENVGKFSEGFIYAGGIKGFTIIDPSKFTTNTTPPTFYYTNIKTKTTDSAELDTSNLELKSLPIPNTWLQTTISFVGLNYSNPERVTYQYRIKERDTNWININTQNFVNLIGLSPGTYTLEVKAANEDGYWCQPKQLMLIFEPKWYQTWWFKVVVALAVAGLFYAFYRYRISQIKKQQQIRKDIAGDLHDDIGSTLNSVKIFTHLAETAPEKQEYFNQIKEALKQASAGLRDMIWVLDDTQDTAEELIKRLQQFASPVAKASNINLEFIIDNNVTNTLLNKTVKRNLLLIAKEAINNSIKYANCKNIHVGISKNGNKNKLVIQDDGKGFSINDIIPGNGLKNMHERARQINYNLTISSSAAGGTIIIALSK